MSASNVVGGRGEVWAGSSKLASFRIEKGTVTIDGRAFHTWTRGMQRPFDR